MPDEMERVRAARAAIDARYPADSAQRDALALAAFMAIFHPEREPFSKDETDD